MIRFRLALLMLLSWVIILFNLERPEINTAGLENINIASMVYVLTAIIMVGMLVFSESSQIRFSYLFGGAILAYIVIKSIDYSELHMNPLIITIELAVIAVTIALTQYASRSFWNMELAIEDVVLDRHNSLAVNETTGTEQIEKELFRAKRAEIPLSLLYLHIALLPQMKDRTSERLDVQKTFRRRYVQGQIAKNVEAIFQRGDVLMWHNDNLILAMPGAGRERALAFAQDIYQRLHFRLGVALNIGVAVFPDDELVLDDLIQKATEDTTFHPAGVFSDDNQNGGNNGNVTPFIYDETSKDEYDTDEFELALEPTALQAQTQENLSESMIAFYPSTIKELLQPAKILSSDLHKEFHQNPNSWIQSDHWIDNLNHQSNSSRLVYRQVKRAFDTLMVLISLPITLPLGMVIAFIIYVQDREPILFAQKRMGYGGRTFTMYKFRSMIPDAEEKLKELAEQGLAVLDEKGKLAEPLKLKRDPRITPIGRIIRKTSLDELPQLLNVLRGDMSLVGPRPTSWDLDSYDLFQTERLSVRPGITGLLQVYDRGNTNFETWVKWDLQYLDKMCFYLDIRLIFMTFMTILFKRKGAH